MARVGYPKEDPSVPIPVAAELSRPRENRPLLGVTGTRIHTAEIVTTEWILQHTWTDAYLAQYAQAVARAGGMPVHVARESPAAELVERLDGILISGGQDVDPRMYGALPLANCTRLDPARDQFEADLIRACLDADKPVIGICRGAQLLNVALGGTLIPDLTGEQEDEHTLLRYPSNTRVHDVRFVEDTILHGIYGPSQAVNSFHHQGVGRAGTGVVVSGLAPDGVIEGIEVQNRRALGVQWHPEMLVELDPLFTWLVEEAALSTPTKRKEANVEHSLGWPAARR